MVEKNIISINNRRKKYKRFVCPTNYFQCEFYNPKQPLENRCIKDSNVGCCVKEYFDFYKKEEVITEHGDTE